MSQKTCQLFFCSVAYLHFMHESRCSFSLEANMTKGSQFTLRKFEVTDWAVNEVLTCSF